MEPIELNHIAAIYIPDNEPGNSATVQRVATELCKLAGGATVQRVDGYYTGSDGKLIKDIIERVYAFHNIPDIKNAIIKIALEIKAELNQESVLIELDNIGILI